MSGPVFVNIEVTDAAVAHFGALIAKEDEPGMGLRMFVDQPGLPSAEVGISFCPPRSEHKDDIDLDYGAFTLYVAKESAQYLEGAKIDYKTDNLGGQLSITAPNLRGQSPSDDAPLYDRIQYLLTSEINPNLASHGGMVTLVTLTDDKEVVLQFGGGCHGCGMVDVTLKHGIERRLKEAFPEITAVTDMTDHSKGENPYYAS